SVARSTARRPGVARALGLRARTDAGSLVPQTNSSKETVHGVPIETCPPRKPCPPPETPCPAAVTGGAGGSNPPVGHSGRHTRLEAARTGADHGGRTCRVEGRRD